MALSPDNVVTNFINALTKLPADADTTSTLGPILAPPLALEQHLRQEFAKGTIVQDPYAGLLDFFSTPLPVRLARTRTGLPQGDPYLMPLEPELRRARGEPWCVESIAEFRKNWDIFTHGVLAELRDWKNIIVAGGSVLACMTPIWPADNRTKLQTYHSQAYASSDVDIFLWGMDEEEAKKKMVVIYNAITESVPWDVVCVRRANTVSIYTQYPHRQVQIVLRLYQSPAEALAGFDIDCCVVCYDGERIWANPRATAACIAQRNTIDLTRRSPSYELFNPFLWDMPRGLARLVVLEGCRQSYYLNFSFPSNRKALERKDIIKYLEGDADDTEENNYDHTVLQVPYASGWDAASIKQLLSKKVSISLNLQDTAAYGNLHIQEDIISSEYNLRNTDRHLHRHVLFVCDKIQDCFGNFCASCPAPRDDEERKLQQEEEKIYIHGPLRFIRDNPGRQLVGSFYPLTANDWTAEAYDESEPMVM
ncbi:hypothetical protein NLJ89_g6545 [Agrocybe chaxingu]|uniref:Uncharacterized protein n=1 Tax=Agrocybe chaxingu TaxID=84603 RepID=A0A9W8MWB0_9AGAR|nr:hypothetical protein NLJ89_g6545 [Agrocybe chaxingu]